MLLKINNTNVDSLILTLIDFLLSMETTQENTVLLLSNAWIDLLPFLTGHN